MTPTISAADINDMLADAKTIPPSEMPEHIEALAITIGRAIYAEYGDRGMQVLADMFLPLKDQILKENPPKDHIIWELLRDAEARQAAAVTPGVAS